jgi:hypothetical protein
MTMNSKAWAQVVIAINRKAAVGGGNCEEVGRQFSVPIYEDE